MYDSEDLRNFTSEFHKRSLEVANSPLREALKVEKKSVVIITLDNYHTFSPTLKASLIISGIFIRLPHKQSRPWSPFDIKQKYLVYLIGVYQVAKIASANSKEDTYGLTVFYDLEGFTTLSHIQILILAGISSEQS